MIQEYLRYQVEWKGSYLRDFRQMYGKSQLDLSVVLKGKIKHNIAAYENNIIIPNRTTVRAIYNYLISCNFPDKEFILPEKFSTVANPLSFNDYYSWEDDGLTVGDIINQ